MVLSCFSLVAQEFKPEGKISIQQIQGIFSEPKWLEGNLNENTRNKDAKLLKVNSFSSWSEYTPEGQSGMKPTYYEDYNNSNTLYFSHLALKVQDVCPEGYRLPKWKDVQNAFSSNRINFGVEKRLSAVFPSRALNVTSSKILLTYDSFNYELESQNNAVFWLDSTITDTVKDTSTLGVVTISTYPFRFYASISANDIDYWKGDLSSGLPVRCIQNGLGQLKEKTFRYAALLPYQFEEFSKDLNRRLVLDKTSSVSQKYEFTLIFDDKGQNLTKGYNYIDDEGNEDLKRELNLIVQNFNVFPYVKDIPVRTNSRITISNTKEGEEEKQKIKSIAALIRGQMNSDKALRYGLTQYKEMKPVVSTYKYVTRITENSIPKGTYSTEVYRIDAVKANGPLNAFLSIVPGWGLSQVMRHSPQKGSRFERRNLIKNVLLYGGLSMGVVGITSKIISDEYYNRYLGDKFGENSQSNYNTANLTNKIFLSATSLYALLSFIDVSFTVPIGFQQKFKQRRVNRNIRELGSATFTDLNPKMKKER